jgi:rRNA maturation endonuclease Nob1
MSVVRQVQELLALNQHGNDQPREIPHEPAHLYRCQPCRETYISDEMDRCPSCNTAVEDIPTERDLGFV